jgi:hypothetical protein
LGDYFSAEDALAEFDALFAARLASGPAFPMFLLNFLALKAVIVVVIDLSVLRRLFD